MPELGTITGEQAAALAGLAPVAHDSGTLRGKRAIAGGRRALRHVMFQAALVAAHHNPSLRHFAERLRKAGKPHKLIITAVARKLVTLATLAAPPATACLSPSVCQKLHHLDAGISPPLSYSNCRSEPRSEDCFPYWNSGGRFLGHLSIENKCWWSRMPLCRPMNMH